ncbi:uncharacterized protein AMSG_04390 [Thecamonas trahens ATCC 50062]|uniref:Uncharacterized protein n=1 Tax=Thecamonas trahens ATCC 50062 TaxID=461836 RepID=A0A0L0D7W8_THETB|nr:hypothetical protein AMSG_04390 [Thecamonas trahens ATCC 50062]KNC48161.1 hypothetical protein AMSG_04390 [Thecamonas trahens ATCC 50062]|eukprot:XP_013758731.1 hypothetical protein AMSG_04390 [Thecamonas trahens ATCC 50062]
MAEAERNMHASRLVFVDEVDRDHFLPQELRDSTHIRFGKLAPGHDVPPVIAATLTKLVERITYAKAPDIDLLHAIILTYKSYASSHELLTALIERFQTGGSLEYEEPEDSVMIKFRVLNALKLWVTSGYVDFFDDLSLRDALFGFLKSIAADDSDEPLVKLAIAVSTAYEKTADRFSGPSADAEAYFTSGHHREDSPPPPLLPADFAVVRSLFDLDPLEVARQLTLMEHSAYCRIRLTELMGCAWSKAGREDNSPNVLSAIELFNGISCLFRDAIVSEADVGTRAQAIEFALRVAEGCAKLNNVSSTLAIIASLSATPIHRLKQTWALVEATKRNVRIRANLEALISNEGNYKAYRKMLNKVDPPAVPYLGMWLTDLTFLEDGNPDTTDEGLINFAKYDLIAKVLGDVRQFQLMRYQLVPVELVQDFISGQLKSALDEEEAYRRSLAVEPRTRPAPDINQIADENVKLKETVRALNRKVASLESANKHLESDISSLSSVVSTIRMQLADLAAVHALRNPAAPAAPDQEPTSHEALSPIAPDAAIIRLAGAHHDRASQAYLISAAPSQNPPSGAEDDPVDASASGSGGVSTAADGAGPASSSSARVSHSGFLKKQSGGKTSKWQKRWCVCRDDHLYYYKSQSDSKPAGVVVLHGCTVQAVDKSVWGKDCAFEIYHEQRRTYRFFAADDDERATWMAAITSQTD